jgi:hypothetical protein
MMVFKNERNIGWFSIKHKVTTLFRFFYLCRKRFISNKIDCVSERIKLLPLPRCKNPKLKPEIHAATEKASCLY